jgi:hypothetical protein
MEAVMGRRKAFTLLELLVVIGIIMVLVSILLPVFASIREQGRAVLCQSNLRQLGQGWVAFAAAHDNRMPGCYFDYTNSDPEKRDWCMGANVGNRMLAPQSGTIFKYVGHNYSIYRCPSLDLAEAASGGPGGGSNGRFDYSAFMYGSGCRIDRLPRTATFTDPTTSNTYQYAAPLIVEEEPLHMNSSHQTESGHANTDNLAHIHNGGSYYYATDNSVQWINEPMGSQAQANYWTAVSIRGKSYSLGTPGAYTWGSWEQK